MRRSTAAWGLALLCVMALASTGQSVRLLQDSDRRVAQEVPIIDPMPISEPTANTTTSAPTANTTTSAPTTNTTSNTTTFCAAARTVNLTLSSESNKTYSTLVPLANLTFTNGTATNMTGFTVTISVGNKTAELMLPADNNYDLDGTWLFEVAGPSNDTICYNSTADNSTGVDCYPARMVYAGINDTDTFVSFKQAVDLTGSIKAHVLVGKLEAELNLAVNATSPSYDLSLAISVGGPTNATICNGVAP